MADRFALARWEPFRELERFLGRGFRWFDWPGYFWHRPLIEEHGYFAPLAVFDRDGETVVRLEVPGVEIEDIDISVSDEMLAIQEEKQHEKEIKEESYYCSERSYGGFRRTLPIPKDIQASKISATYDSGVLEMVLPKVEDKKAHTVKAKTKK